MFVRGCVCMPARTYVCVRASMYLYVRACLYVHAFMCVRACLNARMCVRVEVGGRACVRVCAKVGRVLINFPLPYATICHKASCRVLITDGIDTHI